MLLFKLIECIVQMTVSMNIVFALELGLSREETRKNYKLNDKSFHSRDFTVPLQSVTPRWHGWLEHPG